VSPDGTDGIRHFIGKAVNMDDLVRYANKETDFDYGYRMM